MARKRFRYDEIIKEMVPVPDDWTGAERRAPVATEALVYGGLQATDGTPLDSRRRHREYMQSRGLALMGDFKETGPKADARRRETLMGQADKRERREAIGRALYEQKKGRK